MSTTIRTTLLDNLHSQVGRNYDHLLTTPIERMERTERDGGDLLGSFDRAMSDLRHRYPSHVARLRVAMEQYVAAKAPAAQGSSLDGKAAAAQAIRSYATARGVSAQEIDGVLAEAGLVETPFEPHVAGDIVRTFAERKGATMSEVESMLVEHGLAPVPQPVATQEPVDPGLFHRLVDFARGRGFRG